MKNWLSTNSKLKQSGILSWGIPAARSQSGKLTCIGAKDCLEGCYARQGFYVMPSVRKAQEERLTLSETPDFVHTIHYEIRRRNPKVIRIHDSGDFYSREYLNKWLAIVAMNPEVTFYAYTKAIPLFTGVTLPSNFKVIFSEGGKYDWMIDQDKHRHSRVFPSLKALRAAGYVNSSKVDTPAFKSKNHRIGLIYHGHASKEWSTNV